MEECKSQYNTPCYVLHRKQFFSNYHDIIDNFQEQWRQEVICSYSCKTNNDKNMLGLAKEAGMYAEVVSSNEYLNVKKVGYEDERIIFNGPFKGELVYKACKQGAIINIDNLEELEEMCEKFRKIYGEYPQKLGLRVNFDLESLVPGETSTGNDDGRFGICYENGDLKLALKYLCKRNISVYGIHIHYTTKTRSLAVYGEIAKFVDKIIKEYELNISYIDIGGGFFGGRKLLNKPTMQEYAKIIAENINVKRLPKLILEPGSAMCSTVAEYLTTVVATKNIRNSLFVILDGSSLHINPFQYSRDAEYILPVVTEDNERVNEQILCGATCLEKDRFATVKNFRALKKGEIVKFVNVGGYTMSFLSNFILSKPAVYVED